jgi:predicted transposase/invertase (TIGR01784 family)
MEKIYFKYQDDIISPCWDNVFKAIFTKDTPESRGALEYLLSAILRRSLVVLTIVANEPPVESINERQIRYDINCKFDNGELCNIEMTLNPDTYEPVRLEYYSCKLFVNQDIRGQDKSYNDLKHTYQISLVVNSPIIEDNVFVHNFKQYDEENGISLNGRSHIITIELSKLGQIARKPVAEMTSLERWAVFFRYTPDKEKRELVNEIIKSEEGIAMAGQVLLNISKDERERARLTSEYKFIVDHQSKVVDARRAGEANKAIEIARNLVKV